MLSPDFLFPRFLVFPGHTILAIFHIANVFLSGFMIYHYHALITVALSLAIIIIIIQHLRILFVNRVGSEGVYSGSSIQYRYNVCGLNNNGRAHTHEV